MLLHDFLLGLETGALVERSVWYEYDSITNLSPLTISLFNSVKSSPQLGPIQELCVRTIVRCVDNVL